MDDVGFIQAVFNLTCLGLCHSAAYIGRHRAGLGVRHQAARAQNLTQTAHQAHHVGRGDKHVKINKAFVLNFRHEVGIAHHHCAGLFGRFGCVALGDGNHAHVFAGAIGQHHGAAHLLVGMAAVYAKAHMQLYRLVEFGFRRLAAQGQSLVAVVQFGAVDKLFAVNVMFPLLHSFLLWYIGIFLPLMAGRC